MLTKEQSVFLGILEDHLWERSTHVDNVDWFVVQQYARRQGLEAIFYHQTRDPLFCKGYFSTIYQGAHVRNKLKSIQCALSDIPWFVVKGTEIAKFYPVDILRPMGDIDIVVPPANKQEGNDLIISLGFCRDNTETTGEHEYVYHNGIVVIELHHNLYYKDSFHFYERFNMEPLDHVWEYVEDHELDWSWHFLYLILHLMKHIMFLGVGFRQFFDIAVITKNVSLDWSWLEARAEEIGILPFLQKVLQMNQEWFGVSCPIEADRLSPSFVETMTNYLFDLEIITSVETLNMVRATNAQRGLGPQKTFRLFLKDVFPPYRFMVSAEKYRFLRNRVYLLPFAWIYRILVNWNNRNTIVSKYYIDKKLFEQKERYLHAWGL